MGVANTAALQVAGIDESIPDPDGGRFGREPGGQQPDGYIEEMAALGVFAAGLADDPSEAVLIPGIQTSEEEIILAAQEAYLSRGITTIQEGAASPDDVKALPYEDTEDTAHTETHTDAPGECQCGYPALPSDEIAGYIERAVGSGNQVLAHCNGDASSEQFLDAYSEVAAKHPEAADVRPVMIHAQTVRDDQLDRMPEMGMLASFFSGHVDFWGETHVRNPGWERARRISPARSALDRGVRFTLHQDAPVTDPDMPVSIAASTTRITAQGAVLGEEQAVPRYKALEAVTSESAFQYGEEDDKGRIRERMRADLIVVDRDPLTSSDEEFRELTVERTVKDGRTVFLREAADAVSLPGH